MEPMTPTRYPVLGPLTRSEEILQFERLRHQLHIVEALRGLRIATPATPAATISPPPIPWRKLREIHFPDLTMDTVHEGRVLKCRTVVDPLLFGSLQFLVEELDGGMRVMNISIQNYVDQNNIMELGALFPVGRELWIRNPCVKSHEGRAMIIVDDPVNLKLRQTAREIERIMEYGPADAKGWKTKGDVLASKGRFDEAMEAYSTGTYYATANPTVRAALLRKRAALLFDMGKPQAARREALNSLSAAEDDRTLLLLAKILLQLRSYKKALETLEQIVEQDDVITELLKHVRTCVEESEYGIYDAIAVSEDASKYDRVNHADYVAPTIEIRPEGLAGRGLFAKQAMSNGTLLIATKAVLCIYPDELPPLDSSDTESGNGIFDAIRDEFILRLAELLNNGCERRILQLAGGPQSHGINVDLRRDDVFDDDIFPVTPEQLRPIVAKNSFGGGQRSKYLATTADDADGEEKVGGGALYFAPSFFNHSCVPNSSYFTIGDLMFVKTNRDVDKDEELTIHYLYIEKPSESERKETLRRVWDFTCYCDLCVYERANEDTCKAADQVVEKALAFAGKGVPEEAIKKFMNARKKLYSLYRSAIPQWKLAETMGASTAVPPPSLARHLIVLLWELSRSSASLA